MARKRDDSSPLAAKRRQLEEQERLLVQKRAELKAQLESRGEPEVVARVDQPPVWRMEDEPSEYESEPAPARYRHLARQRRRDMIVFFACIAVLLVIIGVLLWILHLHPATPGGGA